MLRIAKQFTFSASHQLDHLPPDHPCARLHGHNYTATLILEAAGTQPNGFVRDFRDLDRVKQFLDQHFDHRHLNEVLGSGLHTTSEWLACYLFNLFSVDFPELVSVRVSETEKTYAEYWKAPAPVLVEH